MRFNEVKEAATLEKLLDSIVIGDQKLHVNRPRFGKGEKGSKARTMGSKIDSGNRGYLRKTYEQNRKQSYVEVVKNGGTQERKKETKQTTTEQGTKTKGRWIWRKKKKLETEWSGMEFQIEEEEMSWLEGCYTGIVHNIESIPTCQGVPPYAWNA